ncbi:MAG: hypothetical protein JWM56_1006 [Candidatus Peribacteria bacterium]|nr:hypothetical protein [Candidatus Peribacteria bacterium]
MDIHFLSRMRYNQAIGWTVLLCAMIVMLAAALARATINLNAALTDKPDLAIYILDSKITQATLLREDTIHRDYLAQTKNGAQLVKLEKRDSQWVIAEEEMLHE